MSLNTIIIQSAELCFAFCSEFLGFTLASQPKLGSLQVTKIPFLVDVVVPVFPKLDLVAPFLLACAIVDCIPTIPPVSESSVTNPPLLIVIVVSTVPDLNLVAFFHSACTVVDALHRTTFLDLFPFSMSPRLPPLEALCVPFVARPEPNPPPVLEVVGVHAVPIVLPQLNVELPRLARLALALRSSDPGWHSGNADTWDPWNLTLRG